MVAEFRAKHDLNFNLTEVSPRSYDPIIIAAARQQNIPYMVPPPNYQICANTYIRKRSSLIEALNNSIFPNNIDVDEDTSGSADNIREQAKNILYSMYGARNREQIYSVRQILRRVKTEAEYEGENEVNNIHHELDLPARLVRNGGQAREKRSRSHPVHVDVDDDCSYSTSNHVSRLDASNYNVNQNNNGEVKDVNNRSSMHSTESSITTSSTVSSNEENLLSAEAIWDHVAILPDELPFASGDIITVLDYSSHAELWYGNCGERSGWFPSSYVRVINGNVFDRNGVVDNFPQSMRRHRRQIIEELLSTERDYVRLLQDLVQGFVEQTRRRVEMFSPSRVQRIFANLEAICALHCKFLRELELSLNQNLPEDSFIGAVFLRNRSGFMIYSEYCNNRPISCSELAVLNEQPHYYQFFEACRLLRGMSKLSLEGFLLTPVQRICRYPLQLAELLKATPLSHMDREPVQAAVSAMKSIAAMINEKKRRLEGLQKIALWQKGVEGWRGPDLVETNSSMLRSGEVFCRCILENGVGWHKDVQMFLFDQSLILCKKDLIRRNHYLFKDRISLGSAKFMDCPDGKDAHSGITLKNAWKLIMTGKQLIFSCKDKNDKQDWIESLQERVASSPPTPEERRLIRETISRTIYNKSDANIFDNKSSSRFSWKRGRY